LCNELANLLTLGGEGCGTKARLKIKAPLWKVMTIPNSML